MLLELPPFEHVDAKSVREAAIWLNRYGEKGRVVAGGTDLFSLMKDGIEGPDFKKPEVLINIKTIPEMKTIAYDDQEGLHLGAAVTLQDLITSDLIQEKYPVRSSNIRRIADRDSILEILCIGCKAA